MFAKVEVPSHALFLQREELRFRVVFPVLQLRIRHSDCLSGVSSGQPSLSRVSFPREGEKVRTQGGGRITIERGVHSYLSIYLRPAFSCIVIDLYGLLLCSLNATPDGFAPEMKYTRTLATEHNHHKLYNTAHAVQKGYPQNRVGTRSIYIIIVVITCFRATLMLRIQYEAFWMV